MTTTFENAKVGDRVYSLIQGWSEIESLDAVPPYNILLSGCCDDLMRRYDSSGKLYRMGDQILFWDKPEIIAPSKPIEAPPVDTLVEANATYKRYSAGRLSPAGWLACWHDGTTSHTADRNEADKGMVWYKDWIVLGDNV